MEIYIDVTKIKNTWTNVSVLQYDVNSTCAIQINWVRYFHQCLANKSISLWENPLFTT